MTPSITYSPALFRVTKGSKPIVYATFGSVHTNSNLSDIICPLIEATKELNLALAISSRFHVRDFDDFPDVLCAEYYPQFEMLKRSSVMITHGGANSIMESITVGVPTIVIPLSNDQCHQANLVRETGIGVDLPRSAINRSSLTTALKTCLFEPSLRSNLNRVKRSYQAQNGGVNAANFILRKVQELEH